MRSDWHPTPRTLARAPSVARPRPQSKVGVLSQTRSSRRPPPHSHPRFTPGVRFWDGLLDLLYPPACAGCGEVCGPDADAFCFACHATVEPLPLQGCARCSEPGRHPGRHCPRCTLHPPPFRRAHAPFVHGGALSRAVHRFKYEDHPELARPLGQLLARAASPWLEGRRDAWLCPLPLHAARFRARHYDQAWLLAAELSRVTRLPLARGALTRTRATERQVGRDEAAREANVHGAFRATSNRVRDRRLILVDDVFTTGATARAAAHALREAGAAQVEVLTLARAWSG